MFEKIIPVIDLKRGQVVHGIAGDRARYQPVKSCLVDTPHPARVAKAMRNAVADSDADVTDLYVADLDALAGDEPDWNAYDAMGNSGAVCLWIDAGIRAPLRLERMNTRIRSKTFRPIVALETLPTLRMLESIVEQFSSQSPVFSLDLKREMPVTTDPSAKRLSAETIVSFAVDAGIGSIIVLDVAAVGSGEATTMDLCRNIRSRHPGLELISGGGVRSLEDVQRFVDAGCDRVMVASALHDRSIMRKPV